MAGPPSQSVLDLQAENWRVELSSDWDVLGPFPIHAREQHFISPSFPLNLFEPVDLNKTWPSSYADGARVSWSSAKADVDGELKISFPSIRWAALRATEGWAAMQHHAVLRSSITVYPPQTMSQVAPPSHILVQLLQGSYFALVPSVEGASSTQQTNTTHEWHAGNIYAMERALPRSVELPITPSTISPTRYDIYVSGDYEIRLFGDPQVRGSALPLQSLKFTVGLEDSTNSIVHEPTQDVIFDFVDGHAFGEAIGVGIRSVAGWWMVDNASLSDTQAKGLSVQLLNRVRIAPTQTRIIPMKLTQDAPFSGDKLRIDLTVTTKSMSRVISVSLLVNQQPSLDTSTSLVLKASYFYASSMPTNFLALPPIKKNAGEPLLPILSLHGAGVDILTMALWSNAHPRQQHSWIVLPTGRTSWGLDWHGPSARDAWSSLDSLVYILEKHSPWSPWRLAENTVVVMGHSNGGQGAWHIAARYPDRVLAVVPAAGYIKSQAYVPWSLSRSSHFIDPALRAVLDSSLTPDDNDLFLSNLVDTPVLAIHGGDDDNVPVWHSREAVSILRAWNSNANVTYREDPGASHWYPGIYNNTQVQAFLDSVLNLPHTVRSPTSFTLTVSVPADSGSFHGWTIEQLSIPGRLARLHVDVRGGLASVQTSNVATFSFKPNISKVNGLDIDGITLALNSVNVGTGYVRLQRTYTGSWQILDHNDPFAVQMSGRMQMILTTSATIILVIPSVTPSRYLAAALRIAHDLLVYHKLDAQIIDSSEALRYQKSGELGDGNIVVIGDASTPFVASILSRQATLFVVENATVKFRGRSLKEVGLGILFMHPHPSSSTGKMLFVLSTDSDGLERAVRLFPIRTGIPVPDWIITGPRTDQFGTAGIIGAGVWANGWRWNDAMSWIY